MFIAIDQTNVSERPYFPMYVDIFDVPEAALPDYTGDPEVFPMPEPLPTMFDRTAMRHVGQFVFRDEQFWASQYRDGDCGDWIDGSDITEDQALAAVYQWLFDAGANRVFIACP